MPQLDYRTEFYSAVGQSVISNQGIEDFLHSVFSAALGGDEVRALSIFDVAKALEPKINLITGALTNASHEHKIEWERCRTRITQAAEARNQIAHGGAVQTGPPITIIVNDDGSTRVLRANGSDWLELRKVTKSGDERIWKVREMLDQVKENHNTFGHLIVFAMLLKGEEVPAHLLSEYQKEIKASA